VRLGLVLLAPSAGLRGIIERKQGAVRDAFYLVVLSIVAFRLPELVRAVLSFARISLAGGLSQTLGVVGAELRTAAFVTLVAALSITIFAGRGRRDPSLALELGAACYVPYFCVWSPLRLLDQEALLGYVPALASQVVRVVAWVWVAGLVVGSLRELRRGDVPTPSPSPTPLPSRGRSAGLALIGVKRRQVDHPLPEGVGRGEGTALHVESCRGRGHSTLVTSASGSAEASPSPPSPSPGGRGVTRFEDLCPRITNGHLHTRLTRLMPIGDLPEFDRGGHGSAARKGNAPAAGMRDFGDEPVGVEAPKEASDQSRLFLGFCCQRILGVRKFLSHSTVGETTQSVFARQGVSEEANRRRNVSPTAWSRASRVSSPH
jgi:hypothetical protein